MTQPMTNKYLLHKSRIVSPTMEKPEMPSWTGNWDRYNLEIIEYEAHLSTLPGIECSQELLSKWKDGDWLEEGKDCLIETVIGSYEEYVNGGHLVAVPVQSEGEDEKAIKHIEKKLHVEINQPSGGHVWRYIKSNYKLIKK